MAGNAHRVGIPDGGELLAARLQFADPGRTSLRGGDPAEGAAGAVRLALLPDDGPTGQFVSWDETVVPW